MIKFLNKYLESLLKLFGIGTIVILMWQLLEVSILGEIRPNEIDTIIGIILTFSLYGNLKWFERLK